MSQRECKGILRTPFFSLQDAAHGKHASRKNNGISQKEKRHSCRVSAADKGCRVYPLDLRPDAVALYPGCTTGKRHAWFLPVDRPAHCLPCWTLWWMEAHQDEVCFAHMDPSKLCLGKGLLLLKINIDEIATHARFLLITLPNNAMSRKSPFAIQKAPIAIGGEPKSVKR
ncbi:hypothetical protein TNCV_18681 [Trichonephila clavipes]|nr:hypothetical protein TNCV_18681 [Trichonephila clavipes]